MIDIHTHILHSLDDGAKDVETSLAMLAKEKEDGVSEVVFSPHYYGKKRSLEQFLDQRAHAFSTLVAVESLGIKMRLGAEVYMTGVNDPSNDTLVSLAIENTKCVLVELPFVGVWKKSLIERLSFFASDTGYTPIVAHVERYEYARRDPRILTKLVKAGCLLQLNASAFTEKDSERFAFALLKHGMVHCLGTDAHNVEDRAPDYALAKKRVISAGYEREWERVQTHMRRLLDGETIEIKCTPVKKFFGVYF